jgi:hypothetical protein
VAAMEDGYERILFQERGKTMHRRRRNDRLTAHELEERGKDFMMKWTLVSFTQGCNLFSKFSFCFF